MITLIRCAAFMRRNYPPCRYWPRERLLSWLGWYWRNKAVGAVVEGTRIAGVGIARPVYSLAEGEAHYVIQPGGSILWVDAVAAKDTRSMGLLMILAGNMWGERVLVAGHLPNQTRHRVLPWSTLMKKLAGKVR